MTKKFEKKIIRERIVDTKNFRYVSEISEDRIEIKRLPIKDLNTVAALNNWETVKTYIFI